MDAAAKPPQLDTVGASPQLPPPPVETRPRSGSDRRDDADLASPASDGGTPTALTPVALPVHTES